MKTHYHTWVIRVPNKVWVVCTGCTAKFPVTSANNGDPWRGQIPEKFRGE